MDLADIINMADTSHLLSNLIVLGMPCGNLFNKTYIQLQMIVFRINKTPLCLYRRKKDKVMMVTAKVDRKQFQRYLISFAYNLSVHFIYFTQSIQVLIFAFSFLKFV